MRFVSSHQALMRGDVVRPIPQPDAAVALDGDAILGARQVLRHHQPVDAARDPGIVGPERNAGHDRLADHLRHHAVRPSLRLDLPERVGQIGSRAVEIVDGDSLLEHGRVPSERMKPLHHRRQVRHVARADHAGGIRQARGLSARGRSQEQRRRVHGAARHDEDARLEAKRFSGPLDLDRIDPAAVARGDEPARERVRPQRDVRGAAWPAAARTSRRRSSPAACRGTNCTCRTGCSRPAVPDSAARAAATMDAAPARAARRRWPPSQASAESRHGDTATAAAPWDRRTNRRGRGRAPQPDRSRAPACRSRLARPEKRRRRARSPGSPRAEADRARCPRTWCSRRRRSGCTARTRGSLRRASVLAHGTAGPARPPPDSSSRPRPGRSRRARRRGCVAPVPASARAIVPPPAPVPMMMMS